MTVGLGGCLDHDGQRSYIYASRKGKVTSGHEEHDVDTEVCLNTSTLIQDYYDL